MLPGAGTRHAIWIGALVVALAAPSSAELRPRTLAGTRAEAATLIVQGIEGGAIRFAALALPEEARSVAGADDSPKLRVPIAFEIAAAALEEAGGELELYAYAITPDGGVAANLGLALPSGGPTASAGTRLTATLDLEPGTYSLRFLLLDPQSHRFGLQRRKMVLAEPAASRALGPPRVEDSCDGWARTSATPEAHAPWSALPVLVIGSRVVLTSAGDSGGAGPLDVRLVPKSAEQAEPVDLVAEAKATSDAERVELAFELPKIGRGVYELRVQRAEEGAESASPSVKVWVVDPADLEGPASEPCSRIWTAVVAKAAASTGPVSLAVSEPASEPTERDRADRRELKAAYREVLERLARTSDFAAATEGLCRFEERFAGKLASLPVLLRLELEVVRKLAAREPNVLPALMMLHHQAYLEHRRQELFPLAGHSTRAVRAIGVMLIERLDGPEVRSLASRILTSLAEYGHRNRSFIPSQLLLEDALEVEPENLEALKLLSVNYEWFGRYDQAIVLLERLVELSADDREARLRLGLLELRTGDIATAELHLRRILREGAETWILSLAYQALGNLLTAEERFEEANAVLDAGRSRLPRDQRLYLVSAHALERSGRFAEARRLLEELPVDGSIGSPRFRYGESLTAPLASMREELDRAASVRLPLLSRAIGSDAVGSGAR